MRTLVQDLVNGPDYRFIAVTPEDTGQLLDWDILDATNPQNREVRLFDELLKELDVCWGVDKERVHTMGFSLGDVVSPMLGVTRGDQMASIGGWSGGYASDPRNSLGDLLTNWPDLTTANKYVELRIHGGAQDVNILPFGQYGVNDRYYLNENGHDYVECVHDMAHNMGPTFMGPETIIRFFADHPLGTVDTPYVAGFPPGYKPTCAVYKKN
jgi:predicted esterase